MGVLSTYVVQSRAAMRMALADRTNFALQSLAMVVNNGFVLTLWFMFFSGFKAVGGWRMPDLALLVGLLATVVGTAGVFFGGYRDMAAAILAGEPDALLGQPKPVLLRLLARESSATAWGDIATGGILLAVFARITPDELGWLAFVLACGLAVYLSVGVSFACLAFWARGARSFSRDLTDFVIMFASYPGSIYSGATRLLVYTVMPAGFIVLAPISFLRAPSLAQGADLLAAAAAYSAVALCLFHLGLRRYQRGEVPDR